LEALFAQVRGKARLQRDSTRSAKKWPVWQASFALDHGMERVEIERFTLDKPPKELPGLIYCVGPDTAFRLNRAPDTEAFTIVGIGKTELDRAHYLSEFGRLVHAHNGFEGRPMPRVFGSPGFEITSAESIVEDSRNLIEVASAFGPLGSNKAKEQITAVLDPDAGWIIRRSRYRHGYDDTNMEFRCEIQYQGAHEGVSLPRTVRLEEPGGLVRHCEFTEWSFTPTPIAEFNMTHYGLPDLVRAHRRPNLLPYWLMGIAAILALVAFILWKLASRGARSAAA
jgi:hypothetical protein